MSGAAIRLGMLGLGTVGQAVAEILARDGARLSERVGARLELVRAVVRDPKRKRTGVARKLDVVTDPAAVIAADDVDVVVEVAGGVDPARTWIRDALRRGKPVVTANKAVIAAAGPKLHEASVAGHAGLYYEGAVAGGIPIIRTLRDSLASDQIRAIRGVLNGTTNFILGEMESGLPYPSALDRARELGYAEADPTLDVNGGDAADKLAILVQLAYGMTVTRSKLPVEGIEAMTPEILEDAERLGYRVKLLATGRLRRDERVEARVHPAFVRRGTPLAAIPGALNAVRVDSRNLGSTFYEGPGAGGYPTGNAVVSDILEAARNLKAGVVPPGPPSHGSRTLVPVAETTSAWYLRLLVADQPGVLALITHALAENAISLETVLQRERQSVSKGPVPVVVTTFECTQGAMRESLAVLRRHRKQIKAVAAVRVETE